MAGLLLDTNALSAIADSDPKALKRFQTASLVAIPVIVFGEYLFGIGQSKFRSEYEQWLNALPSDIRVLDVTRETAAYYAKIRAQLKKAGTPIPSNDLWIAALCQQHAFHLLSRDKHYDRVKGIQRVDW